MSGSLTIDMLDFEHIQVKFSKLTDPLVHEHLLDIIGALVVSQTEKRIHVDKFAPDGAEWPDWSENYAKHHHGPKRHEPHPYDLRGPVDNHSMLELYGNLLISIQHVVHSDEVEIGSNLVYAGVQQATRPYLGLSLENDRDLDRMVSDYLGNLI